MIYLYSGTPGSGKSLDTARMIIYQLKFGHPVICNFEIDLSCVKNPHLFHYVPNYYLEPNALIDFSRNYFKGKRVKEGAITVVIDECQMMFNARDWSKADREGWNKFFQTHRHYGFDIVLVAQFDRMIDRQIRSLIEYEYIHRKVSNFGWKGKLLCALTLSPNLFVKVKVWYPMHERIGSEFFKMHKKYYKLYDTFKADYETSGCSSDENGGQGVPILG